MYSCEARSGKGTTITECACGGLGPPADTLIECLWGSQFTCIYCRGSCGAHCPPADSINTKCILQFKSTADIFLNECLWWSQSTSITNVNAVSIHLQTTYAVNVGSKATCRHHTQRVHVWVPIHL